MNRWSSLQPIDFLTSIFQDVYVTRKTNEAFEDNPVVTSDIKDGSELSNGIKYTVAHECVQPVMGSKNYWSIQSLDA